MSGRATFGDFARAARSQLAPAAPGTRRGLSATERAERVHEVIRDMSRVVSVMARYARDIETVLMPASRRRRPRVQGAWSRASVDVHQAIQNAAGYLLLAQGDAGQRGRLHMTAPADGSPGSAAASLAVAYDLLNSHVVTGPDGARDERSEWASVAGSERVTRALLLQLGEWARLAAGHGAQTPMPGPEWRGVQREWRRLNAACQWLWIADSAVRSAQRSEPVSVADVWTLNAIPVNGVAPRRLPASTETAPGLCLGVTVSAERIRRATYVAVPDPVWSPALNANSLSQTAACATAISHHCDLLLRGLAVRAGQHGAARLSEQLLSCADAAADARAFWKRAARAWYRITSDTRDGTTPAAVETADLALWTGRLAYRDPAWTLALGPSQDIRPAESLAPEPGDLPAVVAAVHQACATLGRIAVTDHAQISAAASARRLLVPTRSLPEAYDIPQPFTPAPPHRISDLLTAYDTAADASTCLTAVVGAVAADVRAPSHALTLARAVTRPTASPAVTGGGREPARLDEIRELPGPVERIMHDLAVTSPEMLRRAAAIDRASELLILDAAHDAGSERPGHKAIGWNRSAATTELINCALATGNPRATALLRPPVPPETRSAGTGPHHATPTSARQLGDHVQAALEPEAEP